MTISASRRSAVPAQPLLAVGAASVAIPASTNTTPSSPACRSRRNAGSTAPAIASRASRSTVVSTSELQPSDYQLPSPTRRFAAGSYQPDATHRSGAARHERCSSGDVVDGMRIDINDPSPSSTRPLPCCSRWPAGRARPPASSMKALLQDPRDLAAASPLTSPPRPPPTSAPRRSRRGLMTASAADQPAATADDHVHRATTATTAGSLVDASSNVLASGTGVWQAGGTIPTAPDDIHGFSLALAGAPRSGDTLAVAPISPAYAGRPTTATRSCARRRCATPPSSASTTLARRRR